MNNKGKLEKQTSRKVLGNKPIDKAWYNHCNAVITQQYEDQTQRNIAQQKQAEQGKQRKN